MSDADNASMADKVLVIDYTNHRGERGRRRIVPTRFFFGSNIYHPEPQYLLEAYDLDKASPRSFAVLQIHSFGRMCPTCKGNGAKTCEVDGMGLLCGDCDATGVKKNG
jgi:hypothetical protein